MSGWAADVTAGLRGPGTSFDWLGLALICFVLPGVLAWLFGLICRRFGWIREGDLKL